MLDGVGHCEVNYLEGQSQTWELERDRTQGGKKTPSKSSRKTEAAHRFNPLDVKSTGCHICGHKDVDLFILKAPRNSHKQMFTWILNPKNAPQEAEPAERTQILLDSSSRVQIVTVII